MSQQISNNMADALMQAFGNGNDVAMPDSKAPAAKAQVYLNPGVTIKGADGDSVFATLPFGIPIDTQEEKAMTTSPKLNHSIAAGNQLLKALKDKASSLKPGEACTVNLSMELRRRKSTDVVEGDAPVIDIANLFG